MTLVIGTDEAGYGPNLGPLVVSATAWRIPDDGSIHDLPGLVAPAITMDAVSPVEKRGADSPPHFVRIADSKQLYQQGGSLLNLELPCLAFATLLQRLARSHESAPSSTRDTPVHDNPEHGGPDHGGPDHGAPVYGVISHDDFWRMISKSHFVELQDEFWWGHAPPTWPVSVDWATIEATADSLEYQLATNQVDFVCMRSATIVPQRFNHDIKQLGNKAKLLTHVTLQLIAEIVGDHEQECCIILCDRHGGRTKYRDALQEFFMDDLIQVWQESSDCSRYRWGAQTRQRECSFMTGGEQHLPVALASMNSKYLRELSMLAFNQFWREYVPNVKKTAGYPVDAKRFRQDVEPTRQRLHIELSQFWRSR